jgi:hypothetical protein
LDNEWYENCEDNERSFLFDRQTDGSNLNSEEELKSLLKRAKAND